MQVIDLFNQLNRTVITKESDFKIDGILLEMMQIGQEWLKSQYVVLLSKHLGLIHLGLTSELSSVMSREENRTELWDLVQQREDGIIIEDLSERPFLFDKRLTKQLKNVAMVPLQYKKSFWGGIYFFNALDQEKQQQPFSEDAFRFLNQLASQAVLYLHIASLQKELRKAEKIDHLTGAYVYDHFLQLAENEVEKSVRYGHDISILMIEIIQWDRYNKIYGHYVSNLILKDVADASRDSIRKIDSLARLGSSSFMIMLPETGFPGAMAVGRRLLEDVTAKPISLGGHDIQLHIRIGGAVLCSWETGFSELEGRALHAIEEATKETGSCLAFMREEGLVVEQKMS